MSRRVSMMWVYIATISIGVSFAVILRSFFPQIPNEIVYILFCLPILLIACFAKEILFDVTSFIFIATGAVLAFFLNNSLSLEFLAKPSIFSFVVGLLTNVVTLISILWAMKSMILAERLRYLFLGVSLGSLLFALGTFVSLTLSYLPYYPNESLGGLFVGWKFSLVVNIFKSLFLSGLFSFIERLIHITEK